MVTTGTRPSRRAARLVAAVAGAALLGGAMSAPALAQAAPDGPTEHTDLGLDGDAVMEHLRALSDISLDHADDGYRSVGTDGYDAAAAYVEEQLAESGAFEASTRQEFPATWDEGGQIALTVGGAPVDDPGHMSFAEGTTSIAGDEEAVQPIEGAPLSFPTGTGANAELGCVEADYEGFTAGDVALVKRGTCAFSEKVQMAAAAEAAAVLIYNNSDGPLNGTLGGRLAEGERIPGLGLTGEAGTALAGQLADAGEPLLVDASFTKEFFAEDSFNVLADTTAGSDDEVIVIGAHLDGVADGPGVNDNASGVAALLALADQIGAYEHDNDRTIRLAFWGAEEVGLQGSNHYVANLEDAELENIQSYLNYDMIGSENFTVGVYDANESTYPAEGIDIPEGSAELEQVYTDYFDSQDQPWVDSEYSGRSDYSAFITAGVPSGGLFSGADEIKTEEEAEQFGGTAGVQLDRNYHTPDDTFENVSTEAIGIFAPAIGWAAHVAAWDLVDDSEEPTTPAPTTDAPSAEPSEEPTTPPSAGGDSDLPRTGADVAATLSAAALLIAMGLIIAMTAKGRYRTGRR